MVAPQDRLGQQMGEYRLLRLLGKGAFGAVYLAEQVHDGSQAAVKLLQIQLSHPEDFKAFLNEARTIRLRHPHIVPLLDFGLSRQDLPFLVMEYAAGGTLRDRHPRGSRLPLPTIVTYVQQLASALQYAHERRVIHRDVKPENMLLRADGTLLLSDFGIATVAHSSHSLDLQQGIGGTLPYMAPEQIQGQPRPASDQYALGVVIYEWITGQRPFQGTAIEIAMQHAVKTPPSLRELVPSLPRDAEQVVLKTLAKDAKERFATVEQFAQALQTAIQQPAAPLLRNAPIAPVPPPAPSLPSTPFPASQGPAAPPARAGMPADAVSTPQPGQDRSRILNPALPHTETSQTASASWHTDLPKTHAAPAMQSRSPLTPPTPSARTSLDPQPAHASPAQPDAASRRALAPISRKGGFSRRTFQLVMLAVLVVLLGGAGLWAVGAHLQQTAQFATATAAANAYHTAVATRGIQFGFDAQHTHHYPYEHTISPENVSQLSLLWSYQTGDSIGSSSPAIANGVVYVGSEDDSLYALDATSGKKLWSYPTFGSIDSSAAIANGVVYVGSDDHKLYAFQIPNAGT